MKIKTKILKGLLTATDIEILKFFKSKKLKGTVTDGVNYLYVPGDIPICLVAHVDTVRYDKSPPKLKFERNRVYVDGGGVLGADDRAGVYAIHHILEQGYKPHILLTNYEECGARGVQEFLFDYSHTMEQSDIRLFIEIDRRGATEYVTYNSTHNKVDEYISSFGFIQGHGSFSDIKYITDDTKIPSVNVSAGYQNEHTSREVLYLDALALTISRLGSIMQSPIDKRYVYESSVKYTYSYGYDDIAVGFLLDSGEVICMECFDKDPERCMGDDIVDNVFEDEVTANDMCMCCGQYLLKESDDDKETTSKFDWFDYGYDAVNF